VSLPVEPILTWFRQHARELPWRESTATPWAVMVSEFMLQQTPVPRVLPVYQAWMERWPTPASLASDAAGEAVRMWGRLGYPRRALRLHGAAEVIVREHEGEVPAKYDQLRELPGVGEYTAAAIAVFAYQQRHPVLDTNVRRVMARSAVGHEFPTTSVTKAERLLAESLLPDNPGIAAEWSVAVMEVGALVCTAAAPQCPVCPIRSDCAWRTSGKPPYDGPPRRAQAWAGTDRQCRGRLLAVLRESDGPVTRARLDQAWVNADQRARCIDSLIADGLMVAEGTATLRLP
jgi:A/G-specific adenine glycosylase